MISGGRGISVYWRIFGILGVFKHSVICWGYITVFGLLVRAFRWLHGQQYSYVAYACAHDFINFSCTPPLHSRTKATPKANYFVFFQEVPSLAMVIHMVSHPLLEDMVLSLMANLLVVMVNLVQVDMEHHLRLVDMGHHPPLVDMEHNLRLVDMEEHHPLVDMGHHHTLVDMGGNLLQLGMERNLHMARSSLLNRAMLHKVPS